MRKMIEIGVVALTAGAMTFVACGKKKDSGSGGVAAKLKVTQLATGAGATSVDAMSTYSSSDVVASTNNFSWATVDGIKIKLKRVQMTKDGSSVQVADWSGSPKELEIGGNVTAVAINEDVTLTPGDYTGASVAFDNGYSVKAYCKTANKFVYTSSSGIKTLASTPASLPADYDYYHYDFAYTTTATSPTDTSDDAYEGTETKFTVANSGDNQLAVLVDNHFLITCYDGQYPGATSTLFDGSGIAGNLNPYTWSNNNGKKTSDFFNGTQPAFGMSYVPLFVYVGKAGEALPSAETYFVGASSAAVTGAMDFSSVGIVTAAFKPDGSLYAVRGRVNVGKGTTDLEQMFDIGAQAADGSYTLYNGEWMCDANYQGCGIIKDRVISGFKQASNFTTPVTTDFANGESCGQTGTDPHHPEWGNRYRACMGSGATTIAHHYWLKAKF